MFHSFKTQHCMPQIIKASEDLLEVHICFLYNLNPQSLNKPQNHYPAKNYD